MSIEGTGMRRKWIVCAVFTAMVTVLGCLSSGAFVRAATAASSSGSMLLGEANVETFADNNSGGAQAWPYTATASGAASSVSVYVDSGTTGAVDVGLYSNSGGEPGTRLATATLSSPATGAWDTAAFSGNPTITSGTTYWLALLGPSGNTVYFQDQKSGGSCTTVGSQQTSLSSLPSSWTTGPTWSGWCPASMYVSTSGSTAAAPPANTSSPTISGTAQQGDTLTAANGSWTNSPTSYGYQWQDCTASGCSNISGATGSTYVLKSSDVGDTIDVAVTAKGAGGTATATSAKTATVVASPSAPPANNAGSDANLWVSSSGGSCVRQATAGSEVSSQDCGSLNAAYQAAKCGDVIDIDAGTYPDQNIIDNSSLDNCAENVVFQAAPGLSRSQVVIGNDNGQSIDSGDSGQPSSDWTLQDVTVTNEIQLEACEYSSDAGSCSSPSHGITINDIQGGAMFVWAEDMTIENSNFGPCYNLISLTSGSNDNSAPSPSYSPNPSVKCNQNIKGFGANTVFRNNVVHDFLDDDSNTYYDHFECMFLGQDVNVTIDSNEFYDCQIYAIFIQNAGPGPLTIQNNWFWASQGGMGACTSNGNCPAENAGGNNNWAITDGDNGSGSCTATTNVLIRYNSFDPASGFSNQSASACGSPGSTWRFVGNVMGQGGCQGSATYEYNVWLDGQSTCGTGDVSTSSDPFVRTGDSGSTLDDLNLTCGTNPAHSLVTPNTSDYQLNYDIAGNARNTSGPRDAGASADTACGT
jgi:hypothetical protein